MHNTATSLAQPHNILCVDDEKVVLNAIARDLSKTDATLFYANSAEEGLEIIEQHAFSVVISDLRMPGIDGVHFLKTVARKNPDTIRILVSGKADFTSAVKAINQAGLFSFITKPWHPSALKETAQRAIQRYEALKKNRQLTSALGEKCTQLGIKSINLEKEVQSRTTAMLIGMVNALDLRDTETHWHSRRVALFSRRVAEQLQLDNRQVLDVERGALLHDVGKIGVSDTILLKPGKLTEDEWTEMRRHSEYGYQILKNVEFLNDARLLVLQHHERWDGKGYPGGLRETNIYVGARIFAIIDTYDAMTSDRPYRKALPHNVAIDEINNLRGIQFDPDIVDAWNAIDETELQHLRKQVLTPTSGIL